MLTRRQFVFGSAAGLALAGGSVSYAVGVEPRWLAVSRIQVPALTTQKKDVSIRVLHLSDFHLSSEVPLKFIADSIELGIAEKPDLIALTGDFFTGGTREMDGYAETLRRLSQCAPTYACLGNHDGGTWSRRRGGLGMIDAVLSLLEASDITSLVNQSSTATVRGQTVRLIGFGDLWSGMCQPRVAFATAGPRNDALHVVLNHNPDAKESLRRHDWDLMLCGHTHGGQIRLPVVGTPFAPVRDKRYVHGLHLWEDRWLHITSGVGNLHGVRFNCRPEISLVTIG
jgi:uncharacterized protein